MTTLFTPAYAPSYGSAKKVNYRVMSSQFGDGYEQIVPDGLNNVVESWDLQWNSMSEAAANDLEDQLTALAGTTFAWVTPKGVTKNFTCGEVNVTYAGYSNFDVTCSFKESFDIG